LKPIIGKKGFQLHEEAWNAYPYCKTVVTNPGYMKENLKIVLESLHLPDNGKKDNVLGMPDSDYAKLKVHTLDIVSDHCGLRDKKLDPVTYKSAKTNRGPLDPKTWTKTTDPIMTCYKFITVHFKWFGIQSAMENALMDHYRKMLLAFHQQVWCWTDEWYGLTLDQIREIEHKTKEDLEKQIKERDKRGTADMDAA
jgi:hypothetical protein